MGQDGKKDENQEEQSGRGFSESDAKDMLLNKNKSGENASSLDESIEQSRQQTEGGGDAGLGKVKTMSERKRDGIIQHGIDSGVLKVKNFRPLSHDKLASKFLFYEVERKIDVRSATLEELLTVSGMNEADENESKERINDLLEGCSRITIKEGVRGDYRDLSQADKLITIFSIRDFSLEDHNRENKLVMEVMNPKNGFVKKVQIDSDLFEYYDLKPGLMKWYDAKERCLVINSESFKTPLKLYIPTVGVIDYITDYIARQNKLKQEGKGFFNPSFLQEFQFLVPDWRLLDDKDEYLNEIFRQWRIEYGYDKRATLQKAAKQIEIGIKPNINVKFDDNELEGGGSVTVPISFRSLSDIFNISDISADLLGD